MAKRKDHTQQATTDGGTQPEGTFMPAPDRTEVLIGQVLPGDIDVDSLANIAMLTHRNVMADEYDADPGEAPSSEIASERTRDYHQGVREGSLRVIEYIEANWGEVGRAAAAECRKRGGL
jgi:hypothetical protein